MADRIKELRQELGLTQEEISESLGISKGKYLCMELEHSLVGNEITQSIETTLGLLADYYNTSVDYILCRTDQKEPYPKSIK